MNTPVFLRSPAPQRARSLLAAGWILALAILGSALALGSLHTIVLALVAGALGLAGFLAWWGAEPIRARSAATMLTFTGAGLVVFTALQSVPLPLSWIAAIDPTAADVWSRALLPLHEPGPKWATLSLDPIATRVQVLRGVTYLCAFLVSLRLARQREGVVFLERVIVCSGLVMAIASLLHPAIGAEKVFGTYHPVSVGGFSPRHIAPLLNPNHLAGYLNIGMCVALGMTLSPTPSTPRVITAVAAVLLAAVEVWVASRGGTLAMVVGIVLVVVMARRAATHERSAVLGKIVPGAIVLVGIALAIFGGTDEVWHELANTDVSKLEHVRQALQVVPSFPVVGMGRGSYESVFPAFRTGIGYDVFTHPENIVAQWLVEWGLPVALVAGAAIVFALRPASALARTRATIGAWCALACLGVHNLVDFSSEVPGVMIPLSVCAALVVAGTGGGGAPRPLEGWSRQPKVLALAMASAVACAVAVALPGIDHELNPQQTALHERALDPSASIGEFHSALRGAMLEHPAEPYFPFIGAVRASRARDESIVPWVTRALERSPVYGRAHLLLARAFVVRSPAQARLEYRLAIEQEPFLGSNVITEVPALVLSFDDAMQVVPPGPQGPLVLEGLVKALGDRLPSTSLLLDAELHRRDAKLIAPARRSALRALDQLREGSRAPWCELDRTKCLNDALSASKLFMLLAPADCDSRVIRTELLIEGGDAKRGLDELESATEEVQDRFLCARRLIAIAHRANDEERTTRVVDHLAQSGCAIADECVNTLVYLAQFEEARGRRHRAFAFYQKASKRAPERDELVADCARVASSLGLHAEAADEYGQLARKHPDETRWSDGLRLEKQALSRVVLPK